MCSWKLSLVLKNIFVKMLRSKNDQIHDYYLLTSILYVVYDNNLNNLPFVHLRKHVI